MDKRDLSILYTIYETSLDGLLVVNNDREIIDYNSKFLEIWGISPDEIENITSESLIILVKSRVKNQAEFSEKIDKLYSCENEISRDELLLTNGKIIDRYSVPWKQKDGVILGRIWFFRDISKLKTIEKEKLDNEANLNAMVENTPALIWSVNKSYELISFNSTFKKKYQEITGEYPRQKRNIFSSQIIPSNVVRQWKEYYDRALAGERFNVNIDSGPGDETSHQYYSFSPIINDKGKINGVSVFNYDITELVRNRREIEKNRFLLNRAQKISKLGGWEVDLKTREITWTEQVYKIHEVDENFKAKVEDGLKFYHPLDKPKIEKAFNLAATEGEPYDLELRFITAGKRQIWVRAIGEPVFSDTGEIIKVTGVFQDITEQKLNREALERSEERYRLITESVTDMISRHTPEGIYTYVTPSSKQLLGYHPEELTGKSAYEFFHPDDLAEIKKSHETIIEAPLIYTIEYRMKRKNGKYFWVETTSKTIRDADNKTTSIIAVTRNINERKLNEEKLGKLRERLELATQTGHIGIWDWDIENDKLIWDDSMFEIYGADKSNFEKIYNNWSELLHPEDSGRLLNEIELALDGKKEYNTEFRIIRPDGNTRYVKGIAQVKRNFEGKAVRMTGVNLDITEKKLEEERLRNTLSLLQTTFDSIKEGVIAFDSSGNVTSYNSRFIKMFTDSSGRGFDVSTFKLNDMFDCLLQQTLNPDELIEEIQYEMKSGSYKINKKLFLEDGKVFDLLIVPQITDGTYRGTVWSFNDVTDISEATEKMISYANDMENAKLELEEKTRELERSKEILRGVAFSVSMLIEATDYKIILPKVFETLAKYTGVDRVYLYNKMNKDGQKEPLSLDYLWNDENVHLNNTFPKLKTGEFKKLFPEWNNRLRNKEIIYRVFSDYTAYEKEILSLNDIKAVLLIPIFIREKFWGFIGFDEVNSYSNWSQGEISALSIAASAIGSAVEQNMAYSELVKARKNAETANRAKSEFLANMSHEIRTPLNSVIGFTELLCELIDDPRHLNYLESIRMSGKNLLTLINDILDLSKIEAGKMQLNPEPADIKMLFNEMQNIFGLKASEKNLELLIESDPSIPGALIIDEVRLRQILINLVGNAVKFTHTGHVKISAGIFKSIPVNDDKQPGIMSRVNLRISVSDTGIGISDAAKEKIFEAFTQQDGETTKKYGGTGLGLSITTRLVEMMNGTISVESKLGEGSTFTVDLLDIPVSSIRKNYPGPDKTRKKEIKFRDASVLVVDDIKDNRKLVREYLTDTGLKVFEAENGREAVTAAITQKPDLIFMDIRMPVMDGKTAAGIIRNEVPGKKIPIIAITASVLQFDITENKDYFDDYLSKPVRLSDITDVLGKFLYTKLIPRDDNDSETETVIYNNENYLIPLQSEGGIRQIWKEARKNNSFESTENFALHLKKLISENDLNFLEGYLANLNLAIDNFDIEKLQTLVNNFEKYLANDE